MEKMGQDSDSKMENPVNARSKTKNERKKKLTCKNEIIL